LSVLHPSIILSPLKALLYLSVLHPFNYSLSTKIPPLFACPSSYQLFFLH
jgi:hypothetical protein